MMNDDGLITKVAQYWIDLGGDADGVVWSWMLLHDKVIELLEVKHDDDKTDRLDWAE